MQPEELLHAYAVVYAHAMTQGWHYDAQQLALSASATVHNADYRVDASYALPTTLQHDANAWARLADSAQDSLDYEQNSNWESAIASAAYTS